MSRAAITDDWERSLHMGFMDVLHQILENDPAVNPALYQVDVSMQFTLLRYRHTHIPSASTYCLFKVSRNFSNRSFRRFSSCTSALSSSLINFLCWLASSVIFSTQVISSDCLFLVTVFLGRLVVEVDGWGSVVVEGSGVMWTALTHPLEIMQGGLTAGSLSRIGRSMSINSQVDRPLPVKRLESATFLYLQHSANVYNHKVRCKHGK